jgi:hypothetical protein
MMQQEYEDYGLVSDEEWWEQFEPEEAPLEVPLMIPVESSNVQSFGYDEANRMLYVEFLGKGGRAPALYRYLDIEPEIYDQFFAAPSKGKFVWSHLRDRYDYERIS